MRSEDFMKKVMPMLEKNLYWSRCVAYMLADTEMPFERFVSLIERSGDPSRWSIPGRRGSAKPLRVDVADDQEKTD